MSDLDATSAPAMAICPMSDTGKKPGILLTSEHTRGAHAFLKAVDIIERNSRSR